jgi:hypothetical protein
MSLAKAQYTPTIYIRGDDIASRPPIGRGLQQLPVSRRKISDNALSPLVG